MDLESWGTWKSQGPPVKMQALLPATSLMPDPGPPSAVDSPTSGAQQGKSRHQEKNVSDTLQAARKRHEELEIALNNSGGGDRIKLMRRFMEQRAKPKAMPKQAWKGKIPQELDDSTASCPTSFVKLWPLISR
eukprot:4317105-Amphidinium_carterae.1